MSDEYGKAQAAQDSWYLNQRATPIGDDLKEQMLKKMAYQQSIQNHGLGQNSATVPRPETALEGIAGRLSEMTSQLSQLGARLDITISRATGNSAIPPQPPQQAPQGQIQGPQPTLHMIAALFERIGAQIGGLHAMADHIERLG